MAIARQYNLKVIEDAAEMHGQEYLGRKCGSFGDISTVSFYPNKHITTGEGGMIFTDNDSLAERCRSLRNLCFIAEQRFIHFELGYNARMSNLQAAVGLAQLERIEEFIIKKRQIGELYQERLSSLTAATLPLAATAYAKNIYWVFGLVINSDFHTDAKGVMKELGKSGIGTRPFFWSLHEQPVLHKLGYKSEESFPVSENLSRRGFYLPSGLAITLQQIDYVSEKVIEVFK